MLATMSEQEYVLVALPGASSVPSRAFLCTRLIVRVGQTVILELHGIVHQNDAFGQQHCSRLTNPSMQEFRFCCKKRTSSERREPKAEKKMVLTMQNVFTWRLFEAEIILLCVCWYLRYALSYRDLEEIM